MIKMEFAKFMFKFYNKMLSKSFNTYFTRLDIILNYNTRQKTRNEFHHNHTRTETGKKKLSYLPNCVEKYTIRIQ